MPPSPSQDSAASPPLVGIVVLNYNRAGDTLRCLEALMGLAHPHCHVIVVDNGSDDGSPRRLAQAGAGAELIASPVNLGFAGGNNLGIARALELGADYVWLLNNDARPLPGALGALLATAGADPTLGAVGSVVLEDDGSGRVQVWGGGRVSFAWGLPSHHTAPPARGGLDYLNAASLLLARPALEQVGWLDPGFFLFWEDTDLGFRLRRAGWRLGVAPESRVLHRGSASIGFQSALWDRQFTRSSVRFFRRHARFWLWPVLVSALGRMVRRALAGRWANLAAVAQGLAEGLAQAAPGPMPGPEGDGHG